MDCPPSGGLYYDSTRSSSSKMKQKKEISVVVDLYLPSGSKPQLARTRTDVKRESQRPTLAPNDLSQRRVREKSSWMSLSNSKSNIASEHWKPAKCVLLEEKGATTLSVLIDDGTRLYCSINLLKLPHTSVRRIHHSLCERRDCLRIFVDSNDQILGAIGKVEPISLSFPDSETLCLWVSLLRSYTRPEIYGAVFNADTDGGLYRMWRQVDITIQQGRKLGSSRPLYVDQQHSDHEHLHDMDVYCKIHFNGLLSGRTTVQKGTGSSNWHESFLLEDLPIFNNLEIAVHRDKPRQKQSLMGSVLIHLMNFRRGESIDAWFPVLANFGHTNLCVGELKLKIKVDEEIILPLSEYRKVYDTLASRNFLDWIDEFRTRWKVEYDYTLVPILEIALVTGVLMDNFVQLIDREVETDSKNSHAIIFRAATPLTKSIDWFMKTRGREFLEASVVGSIRRLCTEKIIIDCEAIKSGKRTIAEKHEALLIQWCEIFWKAIYEARTKCPREMCTLFAYIRHKVEQGTDQKANPKLSWQAVSSFLFLRYLCPAMLNPHLYEIEPGMIEIPVMRSLKEIVKVLQSLANFSEGQNPATLPFLQRYSSAMQDYVITVSSPEYLSDLNGSSRHTKGTSERSNAFTVLHYRTEHSPNLFKESLPLPSIQFDIAKDLAIINTLVVRHARRNDYPIRSPLPADQRFDDLCRACFDVEEQALRRVSQLAAKQHKSVASSNQQPLSPSSPGFPHSPPPIPTTTTTLISSPRSRKASMPGKQRRSRGTARPSTAPSLTDSDARSRSHTDASVPSSPTGTNTLTRIFSRSSVSSKQSLPIPSPGLGEEPMPDREGEPRSLPPARPPYIHHPRSTSTDSALTRRHPPKSPILPLTPMSPSITSYVEPGSPDGTDDGGKKRNRFLKFIR